MIELLENLKIAIKKPNIALVACVWMSCLTVLALEGFGSTAKSAINILGISGPIVLIILMVNNKNLKSKDKDSD